MQKILKHLIIGVLSICLVSTTAIADVNGPANPDVGCHKIIKKKIVRKHPIQHNNTHPANNATGEVCISCIGSASPHQ